MSPPITTMTKNQRPLARRRDWVESSIPHFDHAPSRNSGALSMINVLLASLTIECIARVGTVDDYQGQEEKIIIISTTLTNRERVGVDKDQSLGFMANPRRFNVALTRAMALCIIVGNPFVMLSEPHWKSLLQYCVGERLQLHKPNIPPAMLSCGWLQRLIQVFVCFPGRQWIVCWWRVPPLTKRAVRLRSGQGGRARQLAGREAPGRGGQGEVGDVGCG